MARITATLILVLSLSASALAQGYYYGGNRRIDPQEAAVIANYWIRSYLRRAPHPEEQRYWANQLLSGPPARALAKLLASEEYYNYAGGTPQGLIRQLIADVGHHEASPYEVQDWLRRMGGLDPRAIAAEFLRENPRNWWPGPAATPPRELRYFYGSSYGGYSSGYW